MIEDWVPEISMSLPPRISDVVRRWVEISPDRVALVEAAGTWTYMQLASVIVDAKAWLLDSGVRPGTAEGKGQNRAQMRLVIEVRKSIHPCQRRQTSDRER